MKLQMKTAKERKQKETFNKHQAKNTKTNFLQAKSSREQFHLIRYSAALTYKVAQSDRLSEVSISLIKQIFHSQRNFRAKHSYYIWKHKFHKFVGSSQSAASLASRDGHNQERIN